MAIHAARHAGQYSVKLLKHLLPKSSPTVTEMLMTWADLDALVFRVCSKSATVYDTVSRAFGTLVFTYLTAVATGGSEIQRRRTR